MPGDDAGVGERAAFEPGQDEVAVRPDDVLEDAEDVDLEFLDARAVEHGPADADHARAGSPDPHLGRSGAPDRGEQQADKVSASEKG